MEILKVLEEMLRHVVDMAIVGFEFVGVFVIILAGLKGIRDYVKKALRSALTWPSVWHWDWSLSLEARSSVR